MPRLDQIIHNINLSEGSKASIEGNLVTVSGEGKSITREFRHPKVSVTSSDSEIQVACELPRRADKAIAGTWAAHLRNMVRGVEEGFEYKLQAVYSLSLIHI